MTDFKVESEIVTLANEINGCVQDRVAISFIVESITRINFVCSIYNLIYIIYFCIHIMYI